MEDIEETRNRDSGAENPESPPLLKTWSGLYVIVLAELASLIALFYLFSRIYQ